jgi:hypothetical protein
MALKAAPVFLVFLICFAPLWGLGSGAFFWPFFMTLFHKQNSAGENPLVRRVT